MTVIKSIFASSPDNNQALPIASFSIVLYIFGWLSLGLSTFLSLSIILSKRDFFEISYIFYSFGLAILLLALASIVGNLNKIAWILQQRD